MEKDQLIEREKVLDTEIQQEYDKAKMNEELSFINEVDDDECSMNNIFSHTN